MRELQLTQFRHTALRYTATLGMCVRVHMCVHVRVQARGQH